MSLSIIIIKGKRFNTSLGPVNSNTLGLKIFLTSEEIVRSFTFDSGSKRNYMTMNTFTELCKKSNKSVEMRMYSKCTAVIANGEKIEFPCMEKKIYIKFGEDFYIDLPFIVSYRIHKNIIGRKFIPNYLYWVISREEFYILRRL